MNKKILDQIKSNARDVYVEKDAFEAIDYAVDRTAKEVELALKNKKQT